jgi:hypothetical protein
MFFPATDWQLKNLTSHYSKRLNPRGSFGNNIQLQPLILNIRF